MLDEKTIKDRMTVLDEDIQKVNEQLVELEKNKVDALAMLNALSGAKQQCTYFLEQFSDRLKDTNSKYSCYRISNGILSSFFNYFSRTILFYIKFYN